MLTISNKDIDYAVKRVVHFAMLHSGESPNKKIESLNLMASAIGLEGLKFDYLISVVKKYYEDEGNIIVGVIMGLFIAERLLDREECI